MRTFLSHLLSLTVLAHCVLGCGWHRASACDARPNGDDHPVATVDQHAGHCHRHDHAGACKTAGTGQQSHAASRKALAGSQWHPGCGADSGCPLESCPTDCPCQHDCPGVGTYLDNGKVRIEIVLDAPLSELLSIGAVSPFEPTDLADRPNDGRGPIPILPVRLHLALQVLLI
jgi:hypothetical protein